MSIMINIQGDLARRLQAAANNQSMPVEQLARTILEAAVPSDNEDESWPYRNQRRLELIRKGTRGELSVQEQSELDELQSSLDKKFETFDEGLLTRLEEMKQAVAKLSAEESNE